MHEVIHVILAIDETEAIIFPNLNESLDARCGVHSGPYRAALRAATGSSQV